MSVPLYFELVRLQIRLTNDPVREGKLRMLTLVGDGCICTCITCIAFLPPTKIGPLNQLYSYV